MKLLVKWLVNYVVILSILSCTLKRDVDPNKKRIFPNMIQNNYNHFIYRNGRVFLNAKIDLALFYDKQDKIEVEGIKAEIYNSKEELTTRIVSDKGVVDREQKNIKFSNNVKIESFEQKIKMATEEIILDYQNDLLIANSETLIQKDDGSYLKSKNFVSNIKVMETNFKELELQYFYNDDKEKSNELETK